MPGAPSSSTPRESQAKFRDRTVWGLYKGPVRGQYSGKIRFTEKPGVQDEWVGGGINVVLTPG